MGNMIAIFRSVTICSKTYRVNDICTEYTLVDDICRCKSNYHATTTTPIILSVSNILHELFFFVIKTNNMRFISFMIEKKPIKSYSDSNLQGFQSTGIPIIPYITNIMFMTK